MKRTALYRALVEAGASEERAREAAESVVYGPEAATRSDIAEVNANIATKFAEANANVAEVNASIAEVNANVATKFAEANANVAEISASIAEVNANVATKFAEADASVAMRFAEANDNIARVRTEVAALEVRFERGLRETSFRLMALLVASQALLFAALRLTGTA